MAYKEYKQLDLPSLAQHILEYWEQNNVFQYSITSRSTAPSFTFYEGPPSANGTPGIHHVMARAVKDIFCRYKTQTGHQVKRKAGWDTHGLPVELQVEKELGITKEDIGKKISVEDYNQKCREAVMKYTDQWLRMTREMGYWVDMDDPYVTYKPEYIETLWNLLKQLYDKGLIYKGFTIQPYSPAAGTGLSSHELNQPGCYRDVKDTSIVAQFKVERNEKSEKLFEDANEEVFFLAWTTTPWTLPSNAALAVGEKIDYVKIRTYNPYTFKPISVILAEKRAGAYFSGESSESLNYEAGAKTIPHIQTKSMKGADLVDVVYEQLMPYVQPDEPAFRVISGDFITTEDGTGIVHIAPTFGADDFRAAKLAGIPSILVKDANGNPMPLVDKQGRFVPEVTDYAGKYVKNYDGQDESAKDYKSTDVLISIKLKEENKAFKVEKYEHSYPHCWRTEKPVLYYPMESWFIKTTAAKDRMVELNNTINWKPASTGAGRFGKWLENLVDWNLSRSRYWGTPLPIWRSEDATEEVCIGSIEELSIALKSANVSGKLTEAQVEVNNQFLNKIIKGDTDLHRPFVDTITLVSRSGQPMKRELDLVDVWFDSGAMPYAQWHYPFEHESTFKRSFPADFIAEGVDQTRGWFFTLHALAVMLHDSVAYKNVIANGLVLDSLGNKMSKSKGNVVNPFETLDKHGPDATRWYMIVNAPPWDNLKFDEAGLEEVKRRFFGTLYNTYNFFALYANLDQFDSKAAPLNMQFLTESDKWILSRLNTVITHCTAAYENYDPTLAARAVQDFVIEDLSNWYVRLNRKRFWKSDSLHDKQAAYQTLHTCLSTIAQLMAPIAPFFAENLYQDLHQNTEPNAAESVHVASFPVVNPELVDYDLEERMNMAQQLCSMIHALRKKHNLKVRQPLSRALIPVASEHQAQQLALVEDLIQSETNIKHIELITDDEGIVVKTVKPNFKKLGAKYGALLKELGAKIVLFDKAQINQLDTGGVVLNTSQGDITIELEDVEVRMEDVPGWIASSDNGMTVALDINLTEDLKKEGIARDLVNRIQNLRKDMGLQVQAKISVLVEKGAGELVDGALLDFGTYIITEVQATKIEFMESLKDPILLDLDEYKVHVIVKEETL